MIATPSCWLFVVFAAVAITTPGPGVLLTVSNALRYGFARSFPGVLGLAIGMLGVGVLSGAGLGALLGLSATAFAIAKYVGAAYLIYLGLTRLLDKTDADVGSARNIRRSARAQALRGQLT